MSWNRDRLAVLKNYQEAVVKEFSTKPIARDPENPKPLGERRKKYLRIEKRGDDIVCIACGTDMLTYKPDDTVIIGTEPRGNWWGMFVGSVLNTNVELKDRQLWIQCAWDHEGIRKNGYIPLRSNQVYKYEGRDLVCLTPYFPLRHTFNRTATSEVLKEYKGVIKYVKGMAKVMGAGAKVSKQDVEAAIYGVEVTAFGNVPELKKDLLANAKSGDPDDMLRAFYYLVKKQARYYWADYYLLPSTSMLTKTLQDEIYTLRQKEKGDLLIPETSYEGTIIKDVNKKYLTT